MLAMYMYVYIYTLDSHNHSHTILFITHTHTQSTSAPPYPHPHTYDYEHATANCTSFNCLFFHWTVTESTFWLLKYCASVWLSTNYYAYSVCFHAYWPLGLTLKSQLMVDARSFKVSNESLLVLCTTEVKRALTHLRRCWRTKKRPFTLPRPHSCCFHFYWTCNHICTNTVHMHLHIDSLCCAHKGVTGTDASAHVLKNWKTVL